MLGKINSPTDLKKLSIKELDDLACEIRETIITKVSKNGGHLAPNLGVVELTIALHYMYNSPKDKIIFDVGHQAYVHKLLTGRRDQFADMRKMGGISGYLKRTESEHDIFGAGHVGTAVSAAVSFAAGRDMLGHKEDVVAVIGDGALTNGLTYEGLNNVGEAGNNVTVVLNDNKWSISKNIGGIAKYLEKLSNVRLEGDKPTDLESIFHALGFKYFGPIDGHDVQKLINVFKVARETEGPKLIHVITKKGHGYQFSENCPDKYHFTNPFILESGKVEKPSTQPTFSSSMAGALIEAAENDKKVIGITAAMPSGTGLDAFAQRFPDQFYDVGIAESHAVVFAAGLALQGFKPVVAIYSCFLQRSYDQIMHDVCLQKAPIVIGVDRAGIVGSDGPTHHGMLDLSYLRNLPNMIVLAPRDEFELQKMIKKSLEYRDGPIAIRYPRSVGMGKNALKTESKSIFKAEKLVEGNDIAILAIGTMVYTALEAAKTLKNEGISVAVFDAKSVKPIDKNMILEAAKIGKIVTIEENVLDGGFGSAVLEELEKNNIYDVHVRRIGISSFVEHGEIDELKEKYGLSVENLVKNAKELIKTIDK